MWGAMSIKNVYINEELPHPGIQIKDWLGEGKSIKVIKAKGKYLDVGTVSSLKMLYREEL
jgi:hypothetical protein